MCTDKYFSIIEITTHYDMTSVYLIGIKNYEISKIHSRIIILLSKSFETFERLLSYNNKKFKTKFFT